MEEIIKKAIEGGYAKFPGGEDFNEADDILMEMKSGGRVHNHFILDPLFWQALGKACGWYKEEHLVYLIPDGIDSNKATIYVEDNLGVALQEAPGKIIYSPYKAENKTWKEHALQFHDINLTEGWSKAVEYISKITRGTALVN